MRIPFIQKVDDPTTLIRPELEKFIRETKSGSSFLVAGAVFWLVGALISYATPSATIAWVIYGGMSVPVLAIVIGKLMRSAWLIKSPYTVLAAVAPVMELAAIPIMIFLQHSNPGALVGILMICEGAHYLVYMWIHLEYYFFILFYLKCLLGVLFLFNVILGGALGWQMLISGILSLVAAILVARDSSRVRELYRKKAEYSVAPVL
jgi:hypothetical protein